MQYKCTQTQEQIEDKYQKISLVSCIGVFIALLFLITVYYLTKSSALKQVMWDAATITAGDYTLQMEITEKAFNWFRDNIYPDDDAKGISIGKSLTTYMKAELEKMLNEELEKADPKPNISEVKIADIVFAFNNAKLINLLRTRGGHIMYQRYDKMREVEAEISRLKDEEFQSLVRPVDAFITFEEEDAYNLGQVFEPEFTWNGKKKPAKQQFMDDDLFLVEATEPTNLIWENRYLTGAEVFKRYVIVVAIIAFLTGIAFGLLFVFKSIPIWISKTWGTVNCEEVIDTYGTNLEPFATKEYVARFDTPMSDEQASQFVMSGVLQCYCQDPPAETTVDITRPSGTVVPTDICKQYNSDKWFQLFMNQLASQSIVILNYVLRVFIIMLIKYIGKDTESEQTKLIVNGVFLVQYLNTGFLLLLVNANMTEQGPILGFFFTGGIADFNSPWFNDIGNTIIGAMMYNIYWPIVEFFLFWGMRTGFRMLDRGICSCDTYKTKKTTLQQYVEIYSGPVYFIHYKYSAIMNITFVTMMYGIGIPVLFPIAAIALFVLYMVEKSMIYFSYRQPPLYDDLLNNNALSILTWAPMVFLGFGYWMLSNHQLLGNDLTDITYATEVKKAGHVWTSIFKGEGYSGPAMPMLVTFWILLVFLLFKKYISGFLVAKFPGVFKVCDIELDEDIENYYRCLDEHDRNWSVKEEENVRDNLKF